MYHVNLCVDRKHPEPSPLSPHPALNHPELLTRACDLPKPETPTGKNPQPKDPKLPKPYKPYKPSKPPKPYKPKDTAGGLGDRFRYQLSGSSFASDDDAEDSLVEVAF